MYVACNVCNIFLINYIVEWACSFLKNKETSLIFNEQMSTMREINANIFQEFFISSIFFLFFNANLIEKCKALRIKIEVLNFVNDINILAYDKFIKEICKTLSKTYNVCMKWAWTHDATFASKNTSSHISLENRENSTWRLVYK